MPLLPTTSQYRSRCSTRANCLCCWRLCRTPPRCVVSLSNPGCVLLRDCVLLFYSVTLSTLSILLLQPLMLSSLSLVTAPSSESGSTGFPLGTGYLLAIGVGVASLIAFASLFAYKRHRRHLKLKSLLRSPTRPPPEQEVAEDKPAGIPTSLMVYSPLHRLNKGAQGEEGSKKVARVSRSAKERTAMAPVQAKSSRHLSGPSADRVQPAVKDVNFVNPLLQLSPVGSVNRRGPTSM